MRDADKSWHHVMLHYMLHKSDKMDVRKMNSMLFDDPMIHCEPGIIVTLRTVISV